MFSLTDEQIDLIQTIAGIVGIIALLSLRHSYESVIDKQQEVIREIATDNLGLRFALAIEEANSAALHQEIINHAH